MRASSPGTRRACTHALRAARSAAPLHHAGSAAPCCARSPDASGSLALPRPFGPSLASPLLAPGSTSTAPKRPSSSPRWVTFTSTQWVSITSALTVGREGAGLPRHRPFRAPVTNHLVSNHRNIGHLEYPHCLRIWSARQCPHGFMKVAHFPVAGEHLEATNASRYSHSSDYTFRPTALNVARKGNSP